MKTVYSDNHRLHAPRRELSGGELVEPYESPTRVERILERIESSDLGEVIEPQPFGMEPILRLHDPAYAHFLETAWGAWAAEGHEGDLIPWAMPTRGHGTRASEMLSIEGKTGLYAFAADTAITAGTWAAACTAVSTALTAQALVVRGAPAAFGLCRPPGHHAAADLFGGYCFFNNAAVAAQAFLDQGAKRVAVLDVDFHHGNGTQSIFYDRSDVLVISLHGDPHHAFPYFWGYADETGAGAGEGWNGNYPLPPGTGYNRWQEALDHGCARIAEATPDAMVVSLGVDAFRGDPISFFILESEDFLRCGKRLGRLRLPTVFVMEGGYAVDAIGVNTVNVLRGFEDA